MPVRRRYQRPCLALGRKVVENLVHCLIELLLILFWFIGKRLAGYSAPNQLLVMGIVHIEDEGSDWIVFYLGCSLAKTAPAPSAHAIVKGLVFLLIMSAADRG